MDVASHGPWLAQCLGNSPASPLDHADLAALLHVASAKVALANDVLFMRDEPVGDVFILEKGKVALTRPTVGRTPLLQILHPGDVFGDVGLFLGRPAAVTAVVLEDAEFLCLSGPDLVRLVSTRPRIAVRWMVSMAARLADTQDRLEELLAGPLDIRLASLLSHAVDDDGLVVTSQETLAQLLGSRRPSIARSLANLEKQGLIERHYRQIRVIDVGRLVALTR
jgi:CRP-like cAMP-binding protein